MAHSVSAALCFPEYVALFQDALQAGEKDRVATVITIYARHIADAVRNDRAENPVKAWEELMQLSKDLFEMHTIANRLILSRKNVPDSALVHEASGSMRALRMLCGEYMLTVIPSAVLDEARKYRTILLGLQGVNDKWLDELPSLSGFSSAETKSAVHALNRYGFIQMTNFGKKRGKSRFAVSLLPLGEDAIKYTQ
ncbi:MAG: hypothetical protein A2806_01265 [Candidatus Terrybacteria bacterium RIFCSPHIGHO2_01_FULL_48_17]|uniref:Uncharacterized protein n=1 Tax=Candidatus Terrybacteria bacterium RIFCSPHIGHO2_01_FULL_48_17 TaxID=1802362 RepID=A0A1G2PK94_9BACT|nr:MAG: hypothetical protein A2806_01265 [Candidatus Terrybacteria bacterium RIFCSPHIGHO2_01_FULL_48_17]OHA53405.1 MAG: hypothetical protein A3A30_02685 [Candidatus Terrybacteria bacterium RIFCSPLOWO2_01_FULL_48_14]